MMAGTVVAGVRMTATSAASGSSDTLRMADCPATVSWDGFTKKTCPSKPDSARLRRTTSPSVPGVSLAPTSTIDAGLSRAAMRFTVTVRSGIATRRLQRS